MRTTLSNALLALPLLTLTACGQAQADTRPDTPVATVAMSTPLTDSPAIYQASLRSAPVPARFPEEVLRDPAQRFALGQRLRTEVVSRTRREPDARWYNQLRPTLRRQLEQAGLPRGDVDFLLREIDESRR